MSADRDVTRIVRSWLKEDAHEDATRVLNLVLEQANTTRQRRSRWPAWRLSPMTSTMKLVITSAAVVVVAVAGALLLRSANVGTPRTTATAQPSPLALPALSLPGTRGGPAGVYGWDGAVGNTTGMHRVVNDGEAGYREATALLFRVDPDCFAGGSGPPPVAVTVAGYAASVVDPYVEAGLSFNRVGDEIIRAYGLPVGDRTLCVYLVSHPATTQAELDVATQVIESIRAVELGANGIRINFTTAGGWDTG